MEGGMFYTRESRPFFTGAQVGYDKEQGIEIITDLSRGLPIKRGLEDLRVNDRLIELYPNEYRIWGEISEDISVDRLLPSQFSDTRLDIYEGEFKVVKDQVRVTFPRTLLFNTTTHPGGPVYNTGEVVHYRIVNNLLTREVFKQ